VRPEALEDALPITADSLLAATVKKKALQKGLMALTVRAGAKDFYLSQPITQQSYVDQKVNSHHLYPKAVLNSPDAVTLIANGGYSTELILNRALIDAGTNRQIGAKKPSLYVDEIRAAGTDVDTLVQSHLADAAALEADDYPAFLQSRLGLFIEEIRKVTGKPVIPLTED